MFALWIANSNSAQPSTPSPADIAPGTLRCSAHEAMELLEKDFAHFGYPHTIVSDNAQAFLSAEFQDFCKQRGIIHLTGAPYHPATNGAAERLVQTFKKALRKSSKSPNEALLEFLIQYRRTPDSSGFSPSELLNGRQIRARIDTLFPTPAHVKQREQMKCASKGFPKREIIHKLRHSFKVGDPCYALYFGPERDQDGRWVPAIVTKRHGSRSVNVKVTPRGPIWRRHIDQLQFRYTSDEDADPGENEIPAPRPSTNSSRPSLVLPNPNLAGTKQQEYGPHNPRRSKRQRKPRQLYCC